MLLHREIRQFYSAISPLVIRVSSFLAQFPFLYYSEYADLVVIAGIEQSAYIGLH